jgi:hypothetical protein
MNMNSQSNDMIASNMYVKNSLVVGEKITIGNSLISKSIFSDGITTNLFTILEQKNGVLFSDANGDVLAVAGPPFIGSSGSQAGPQPFPSGTALGVGVTTTIGSIAQPFVTTVNTDNALNPTTGVYTCPVSGKYRFSIHGRFNNQGFAVTGGFLVLRLNGQTLDNYVIVDTANQVARLRGDIILDCQKDSTYSFTITNNTGDGTSCLFNVTIQFEGI